MSRISHLRLCSYALCGLPYHTTPAQSITFKYNLLLSSVVLFRSVSLTMFLELNLPNDLSSNHNQAALGRFSWVSLCAFLCVCVITWLHISASELLMDSRHVQPWPHLSVFFLFEWTDEETDRSVDSWEFWSTVVKLSPSCGNERCIQKIIHPSHSHSLLLSI